MIIIIITKHTHIHTHIHTHTHTHTHRNGIAISGVLITVDSICQLFKAKKNVIVYVLLYVTYESLLVKLYAPLVCHFIAGMLRTWCVCVCACVCVMCVCVWYVCDVCECDDQKSIVCMYVCLWVCDCVCVFNSYVCVCVCVCVCVINPLYVCMYVWVCVCVYVCACVCVCITCSSAIIHIRIVFSKIREIG